MSNKQSERISVGITGQTGFIGTHLYNTLGLYPDHFKRVLFQDDYFQSEGKLQEFVSQCDVVVHLAAVNRHSEVEILYDTNVDLVKRLISACEAVHATPHILFSSSTQEERDNPYGNSKKEGRQLLLKWAERNDAQFTGLIIPNVFGPFGHPYYNSVVATFCHQLSRGEQPNIEKDAEVNLIYIGNLVRYLMERMSADFFGQSHHMTVSTSDVKGEDNTFHVPHDKTIKVSKLLEKLMGFKDRYFGQGIIPELNDYFNRNLFNTFLCYIDYKKFFPFELNLHADERGSFVETMKLNSGGQVSFSTTKPGITRGNHFHTRKTERFAVIKGKARIEFRRIGTNELYTFDLDGNHPSFVDMPIWFTHNITNIGDEELYTLFWINEHYNPADPDTWFEEA